MTNEIAFCDKKGNEYFNKSIFYEMLERVTLLNMKVWENVNYNIPLSPFEGGIYNSYFLIPE